MVLEAVTNAYTAAADGTNVRFLNLIFKESEGGGVEFIHTSNASPRRLRKVLMQMLLVLHEIEGPDAVTTKQTTSARADIRIPKQQTH